MPRCCPWPHWCQEHPRAGGTGTRCKGPPADAQARMGPGALWLRGFPALHVEMLGLTPKNSL